MEQAVNSTRSRIVNQHRAEEIADDLARTDPTYKAFDTETYCTLCSMWGGQDHEATCVWRRARERAGLPVPYVGGPMEDVGRWTPK